MNMKRWYVFFLLVAVMTALASLGVFSGSVQQQIGGQAGPGKLLFLVLLAIGGVAFACWLAISSARKSDLGSGNVDPRSQPNPPGWQPPRPRHEDTSQSRPSDPHRNI